MSTPAKNLTLASAAASTVGAAVGIYAGMNLLVPAVAAGIIWYVGSKLVSPADPRYLGAIALLTGHVLWLTLGMAILNQWGLNVIDLVVFGLGIAWLWLRPGIWPIALITAFQAIALATNIFAIAAEPLASVMHKALVVHIVLRLAVVFLVWQAFIQGRQHAKSDA